MPKVLYFHPAYLSLPPVLLDLTDTAAAALVSSGAGAYPVTMPLDRLPSTPATSPAPAPGPTPTIAFSTPATSVSEGNSGTKTVSNTLTVNRDGLTGPLTINLSYGGTATNGTDYTAPVSGTIASNVSTLSFDVTVSGDTVVETDETVIVTASLSGYAATATRTITITNDDVTVSPGAQEWLAGDQLSWPTDIAPATTADNTFMAVAITMEAHPWAGRSPSFCLHNYYRSSATAGESVASGSFTYEAIYVELQDGSLRQLFVDGSASVAFPGGTGKWKWTDNDQTIPLSAGERYRLWLAIAAPVGAQLPTKGKPVVPVSQFAMTNGGGDVFATGSSSFAAAIANKQYPASLPPGTFMVGAPCLATITGVNDGRDVALLTGDSLVRYHHMYAGYGARNMRGNFGYGYALADPTNGRIPYGCLSASSTRPSNLSASGFAARKAMLAAKNYPFNVILNEMGGNSLASSYKSDFDAMWAFLKTLTADTAKPIGQVTIPARPTINSTSGGTTLAGQTADVTATRDGANDYILSEAGRSISFVIDMNKTIEDAAGVRGKMPVPGFVTSLAAAANVGDTVLSLVAAPKEGDFLSIGVGSTTNEDVFVNTVTGTGPYTVTIQNAGQYTGGIKSARAANAAVGGQATIDGTHYSTQQLIDVMAPFLVANKANGKFTGRTTPAPNVTLSGAQSKNEGNSGTTAYTYTVTRSTSTGAVNVPWSLAYGSADATDFDAGQATSGTIAFADGATTGTVTILVKGETAVEGDETFTLSITVPAGYISGAAMSATGTILNDDSSAPPSGGLPTANRQIHYDYSDMSQVYQDSARTTLVTADGQPVQSVTDQANGANTIGTGTYRTNAANGKGGILFNGTSDGQLSTAAIVNSTFSGTDIPYTIHWVEKVTQLPAATAAPWSIVSTGFQRWSASTSNNYSFGKRNNATNAASLITDTANNPAVNDVNVWTIRHNGTTADIFKNGALIKSGAVTTGATTTSRLTIGSSTVTGGTTFERYWAGIMFEWAAYNVAQVDADITSIHTALKSKYGIA